MGTLSVLGFSRRVLITKITKITFYQLENILDLFDS